MDFTSWLQEEIDKRGWGQAELARRSDVTAGQISRLLRGTRQAGPELCISIAKALGLPREEVFRVRGWLQNDPDNPFGPHIDPRVLELAKDINVLPFESREAALNAMKPMLDSIRRLTFKEPLTHSGIQPPK